VLRYIALRCAVLRYIALCIFKLHCAVLRCAMLCNKKLCLAAVLYLAAVLWQAAATAS
jgi:hypothetical protein